MQNRRSGPPLFHASSLQHLQGTWLRPAGTAAPLLVQQLPGDHQTSHLSRLVLGLSLLPAPSWTLSVPRPESTCRS
jgi:hypothetical protein